MAERLQALVHGAVDVVELGGGRAGVHEVLGDHQHLGRDAEDVEAGHIHHGLWREGKEDLPKEVAQVSPLTTRECAAALPLSCASSLPGGLGLSAARPCVECLTLRAGL